MSGGWDYMEGYVGRRVMGTEMQRRKRIARQKKTLLDSVRADLKKILSEEEVHDPQHTV